MFTRRSRHKKRPGRQGHSGDVGDTAHDNDAMYNMNTVSHHNIPLAGPSSFTRPQDIPGFNFYNHTYNANAVGYHDNIPDFIHDNSTVYNTNAVRYHDSIPDFTSDIYNTSAVRHHDSIPDFTSNGSTSYNTNAVSHHHHNIRRNPRNEEGFFIASHNIRNVASDNGTLHDVNAVSYATRQFETFWQLIVPQEIGCERRHHDIRRAVRAQRTAGEWLLKESDYASWRAGESDSHLFWLTGAPGVGKTVLSSRVIDDIVDARKRDPEIWLVYFYGEPQDLGKHSPTTLFATLLAQLLRYLPTLTQLDLKRVFIVIDGLDGFNGLGTLVQDISKLATDARVFVASRDDPIIRDGFRGDALELQIHQKDIAGDLHNYLEMAVRPIRLRFGRTLAREVVDGLTAMTTGTFLLPVSYMRQISRLQTVHDIRTALNNPPQGIEETFMDALKSIQPGARAYDPHTSKHLLLALRWVMCATRPLKLEELKEAVAIPNMNGKWDSSRVPEWEVDDCANLLILAASTDHPESEAVIPFHPSVKEFFLKNPRWMMDSMEARTSGSASLEDVHDELARYCLSYMSLLPVGMRYSAACGGDFPFAAYAIDGCIGHIRQASRTPMVAQV